MSDKEFLEKSFGHIDEATITLDDGRILKGYISPEKQTLGSTCGYMHIHLTREAGASKPDAATSRYVSDDQRFFGTLFVKNHTMKDEWGLFRNAKTGQAQDRLPITSFFFD